MKITILIIAMVVAIELANRGHTTVAAVLIFVAIGEAFLFGWVDRAIAKVEAWNAAYWAHYKQASKPFQKIMLVPVVIGTLVVSIGGAAIILYAAWYFGIFPID